MSLTDKQLAVLKAMASLTAEAGYPPLFSEIAQRIGESKRQNIIWSIQVLKEKGMITMVPHSSRTIKLTQLGLETLAKHTA